MNNPVDIGITGYRGIDRLSTKKAAKTNLVVGHNGMGKTSLLEATWPFNNRNNPETLRHFDLSRSGHDYVKPVAELGSGKKIHLTGTRNGIKQDCGATFEELAAHSAARLRDHPPKDAPIPVIGGLHVALNNKELGNFPIRRLTREGYVLLPDIEHTGLAIFNAGPFTVADLSGILQDCKRRF